MSRSQFFDAFSWASEPQLHYFTYDFHGAASKSLNAKRYIGCFVVFSNLTDIIEQGLFQSNFRLWRPSLFRVWELSFCFPLIRAIPLMRYQLRDLQSTDLIDSVHVHTLFFSTKYFTPSCSSWFAHKRQKKRQKEHKRLDRNSCQQIPPDVPAWTIRSRQRVVDCHEPQPMLVSRKQRSGTNNMLAGEERIACWRNEARPT